MAVTATLVGSLTLGGCFSDEQGTVPTSQADQNARIIKPNLPHSTSLDRFEIQLDIKGAAKPNAPLQITARVRGKLATELARVQITLPELEAYGPTGTRLHAPLGQPMRSLLRVDEPIAAGQERVHRATVRIPTPGYYRVAVTASPLRSGPTDRRVRVQDVAFVEQWVYVDETRGRITPALDRTVFGPDEYQLPGPRRPRTVRPAGAAIDGAALMATCTWSVKYADNNMVYFPVQDAEIMVSGSRSFTLRTDAFGRFNLCPAAGETFHFRVNLRTARIQILELTFAQVTGITSTTPGRDVIISSLDARVFENLNRTIAQATALFTHIRSQLIVDVMDVPISHYNPDKVYIDVTAVWGESGILTAAHEYGHAYHEKALGGFPGGNCPQSGHTYTLATNMICAWAEGFAEFFAVVTRRDVVTLDYHMERDWAFPGRTSTGATSYDGSIIEGAVAAFLYDLLDDATWPDGTSPTNNIPNGNDEEPVAYPGKYLADVIRTCGAQVKVLAFPSYTYQWTVENAIDFLTYCLERRVDPAVTGNPTYFPTRGTGDPIAQQEGATEPPTWDANHIRNLWVWSLYTNP